MFEIYRDTAMEWRWRLVASNGRIVADSGEGYKRKSAAVAAASRFRKMVVTAGFKLVPLTDKQKREIAATFKKKLASAVAPKRKAR